MYVKTDSLGRHEIMDGDDETEYNQALAKLIALRNKAVAGDQEALKSLNRLATIAQQGNPKMLRLINDMNQRTQ
jgi:hypothetical protein